METLPQLQVLKFSMVSVQLVTEPMHRTNV
jgi:hypothetical protein